MSKIKVKDTSLIALNFSNQISVVKELIGVNCDPDKIKKTTINDINDFLSGKNVAGIGQGRFSDKVKKVIQENWEEVKKICYSISSEDNFDELYKYIKQLQNKLIGYCENCGSISKNGKPIVPWAAIHAMVAVLRPQDFCTIVTENNLDNLYKLLAFYYGEGIDDNAEPTVTPEVEPEEIEDDDASQAKLESEQATGVAQSENEEDNEIVLDNAKADWKDVDEAWKNAKNESRGKKKEENISWYIKSKAMHNFFKKLKGDNYWTKQSYAWETLIALRGDERIKTLAEKLVNKKQYNIILTGAPGTGKTYLARQIAARIIGCNHVEDLKKDEFKERFEFVQFHPSYDYTDFVEGLRPYESKDASGQTTITFKREDGIFKRFCAKAARTAKAAEATKDNKDNKENKYVFIIDEINRGEISKIFGELFFSIDPGYRLEENRIPVRTQYQNLLQDVNDPFKNGFYVPENVYIIGTMNDIDRSVESMDFAFRRRFAFIEVTADDSENMLLTDEAITDRSTLVDKMHNLNAAILKCGLTSQYQIGGAYFKKIKDVKNYTELWNEYLKGTLYEYFRGEPETEITKKMELLKEAYDKGNGE